MKMKPGESNKKVLQMVRLLRQNGKMKASEIAEALGLNNTRSISNYKRYIELMGIPIKSINGNTGGYIIEGPERLSDQEIRQITLSEIPTNIKEKIFKLNDDIF